MTIRVITADDHDVVIAGVGDLLESEGDIKVVGTAAGPSDLFDVLGKIECDVLVTDFSMPNDKRSDGIQMLDMVRRQHPKLAIVVLTMVTNGIVLKSILKHGAIGLCDKGAGVADIVEAVRRAVKGQGFISSPFRELLDATGDDLAYGKLSPREVEVVRLFGEGLTVAEIAVKLNRTKQTVSRQKYDAMLKLGFDNDALLIDYARSVGLYR